MISPDPMMPAKLAQIAKEMVAQWAGLGELVRSGLIVSQAHGWYSVTDPVAVLDNTFRIAIAFEYKDRVLTRVRFEKPDEFTRRLAEGQTA